MKALTNTVNRTYNCTCVNGYDEDSRNHWKCAANRGGCEPGESTGCLLYTSKHGYLDEKKEKQDVSEKAEALKIRMTGLDQRIIELSGGNQQKAVFAKALMTNPKVFLCDEPTQAVDIMTRNEIHKLLREKADAGNAVVYVSSDLKEILEVADTIQLVVQGETRQLLVNENLTTTEVLSYCYE